MSSISDARGAITRGLTGYFDFNGVATRRDYWTWIAAAFIVNSSLPWFAFLLIIPTLAYGARRMHDVGKSGWWLLIFPVALYFSLQPSKSRSTGHIVAMTSKPLLSTLVTDTQNFLTKMFVKLRAHQKDLKIFTTSIIDKPFFESTSPLKETDTPESVPATAAVSDSGSRIPADLLERSKAASGEVAVAELPKKHTGPSDSEVFLQTANSLGLVTANNDSIVAVTQSLVRHIWSQVRYQQEADPWHSDHLRLAIRALAEFGLNDSKASDNESIERAKALLWYGILLSLLSTEDNAPTTFGEHARLCVSDALRSACKMFESIKDQKMAARCMEELGQFGRLISREDLTKEGFNGAIKLFDAAGASERAKQAMTNSGANFQRHSSAFFDGGQHSLKATTILGSSQSERLRATLHHVD